MDHNSKVIIEQNQIVIETTVAPVDIVTIGMQGPSGGSGSVSSVNGQTGAVNLSASDVGAATSEQGAKADSALQLSDVSTAGKTGSYNDLTNKPSITGTLLAGLTTVAASAITATDSIIGALAKLQASIDTKADAANTLLLLNNKQNKLPTDGTAGQFLAHDMTFKTPSGGGGGGGETLTWVDLPVLTSNNYASGAADGTDKLQVAKSADGYIWIRGIVRNTSGSNNSTSFAALPLSHMVYVPSAAIGFNVVTTTQLANTGSNNELPGFVSHGYFVPDSTLRSLNKAGGTSGSSFVANSQYFIAPSILGIAKKA